MEQKKKLREALRQAFTKLAKDLELSLPRGDSQEISVNWEMLQRKFDCLETVDGEIASKLLESDVTENQWINEIDSCDNYRRVYLELKIQCDRLLRDDVRSVHNSIQQSVTNVSSEKCKRKFKLPPIEFKKYNGDIREWFKFWSQFKKVHEDTDIALEDKIEYLIQATLPGSQARQIVESFPPIADNYQKIVNSLISRFGREDLQIEVYVRELLKLVLNNALTKNIVNLFNLYDQIETQLQALETLGVTSDKYSAMLYPLIESCIPDNLLRVWQRSTEFTSSRQIGVTNDVQISSNIAHFEIRLKGLMSFLKGEVENEQLILLANERFGFSSENNKPTSSKKKDINTALNKPTATDLVNHGLTCIFCGGSHSSENCFKAQHYSLEQKRECASNKNACYRCLKNGHSARKCRERLRCILCNKPHLTLMCPSLSKLKDQVNKPPKKVNLEGTCQSSEQALSNHSGGHVFLQTLRVNLVGKNGSKLVRVLIDSGSQRSYILKSSAQEIGYESKRTENIVHLLFGGLNTSDQHHNCYDVSLNVGSYTCNFEALDQAKICQNISSIFFGPWIEELRALNIFLSDTQDTSPIEVLIGADVAGKLFTGQVKVLNCGLVAVGTRLGWTLMGKIPRDFPSSSTTMSVFSLFVNDTVVADLWRLDVLGITEPTQRKSREELELATQEFFMQTISTDTEGRYEVRLPWIDGHPPLPSNYSLAKKRLESTLKKLESSQMVGAYDLVFKEWETEGIIEEISETTPNNDAHYLPHHPVIKESSLTTKIRPVFDASSHEKGKPSLNHCLEKGPNLLEIIPSILIRFRQQKLGVVSDIRKAFLQIGLHETDRDYLRFLWINDEGNTKVYRHRRVVFGVNSSPYLLGATIKYHLAEKLKLITPDPNHLDEIIKQLGNSFYVDNCVTSVPNYADLKKFIDVATSVMNEAKFDLRGWEYTQSEHIVGSTSDTTPVLGLVWNTRDDTLCINEECLKGVADIRSENITKRHNLSIAQKIFDPIGFTSPVSLLPKLLLQETWEQKISWDSQVGDEMVARFMSWIKELDKLSKIKIPRWIFSGLFEATHWSLHTFCDASQKAYSTCIFLRVVSDGKCRVFLLAAKSRVTPIKKLSIPRLELLAATIGARLYDTINKQFKQRVQSYFWSDSSTVLAWISRKEEWGIFVWNRITEIRGLTDINSWRHVPGSLNPADLPSRGCDARSLLESRWWEGPEWLYGEPNSWPTEEMECDESVISLEKKKKVHSSLAFCNSDYWHLTYFWQYSKTTRTIAWVLRFTFNLRNINNNLQGPLTAEEVDKAEIFILKIVQTESFDAVTDKRLSDLHTFTDGLIRVKTRISSRNDTLDFRFPIVLPGKHPVISQLISHYHQSSCHVGTQGLLGILRERFWILGGRRSIRSVITKCRICKRYNSKPLQVITPPLPFDRVRDAITFEVTGVDFAGPLHLKSGEKVWISLFTCAVYRAIHLELVGSLSTASFIQCLRRFVARRGRPKIIYSDNGTNFVGTENAFGKLNWENIASFSSVQRIQWRLNPPIAAWWGGFWERLIGVLKGLLRKVLGKASLNYEDLLTVICECEAIINARPITYVSADSTDLAPLTPAMFLRDQAEVGMPDCDLIDQSSACRKLKHKQKLREDLRKRFRSEYLAQLQVFQKKKRSKTKLQVGDVVLVGNDHDKRLEWPFGRITELIEGRDKEVRLARISTARGQLLRPLQRLYPLECAYKSEDVEVTSFQESEKRCGREHQAGGELMKQSQISTEDSTSDNAEVADVSKDVKNKVADVYITKRGRVVKPPDRFMSGM